MSQLERPKSSACLVEDSAAPVRAAEAEAAAREAAELCREWFEVFHPHVPERGRGTLLQPFVVNRAKDFTRVQFCNMVSDGLASMSSWLIGGWLSCTGRRAPNVLPHVLDPEGQVDLGGHFRHVRSLRQEGNSLLGSLSHGIRGWRVGVESFEGVHQLQEGEGLLLRPDR